VNGKFTRMLGAVVAGIALTASCVASAGAAGVAGLAVRAPASSAGPVPVTANVASGLFHGKVTPIRTATNSALPAIAVGSHPGAIAITPNGKTAYAIDSGGNHVTPIDTATNRRSLLSGSARTPLRSRSLRTAGPPTSRAASRTR